MVLSETQHQKLLDILQELIKERYRQQAKFGTQDWPVISEGLYANASPEGRCVGLGIPSESEAKMTCNHALKLSKASWFDIIIEELSESVSADKEHLREELVQLAAVVVAAIESLDRNTK